MLKSDSKKIKESSNVLDKYYELILRDREYTENYIWKELDFYAREMQKLFIWRKIKNPEELENVIHSKNAMKLLRIDDYYIDEEVELLNKYLNIDFNSMSEKEFDKISSDKYLQRILKDDSTPQQLKECISLEQESRIVCKELLEYIMLSKEKMQKEKAESLKGIKKCAIFVHYSINDPKRIEEKKNRLIDFCKNTLKTNNYEVFIEIGSFLNDRTTFDNMLKQFKNGEYSHLIVTNLNQIYKLSYSLKKNKELLEKIQKLGITVISLDEEWCFKGERKLGKEIEESEEFENI